MQSNPRQQLDKIVEQYDDDEKFRRTQKAKPKQFKDDSYPNDYDGVSPQHSRAKKLIKKEFTTRIKGKRGKRKNYFVADVHYIGELLGGIGFNTSDGLFAEMLVKFDKKYWNFNSYKKYNNEDFNEPRKIQTHTTFSKPGEMHFWSHPIDLHFQANAINGWPKAVFRVWKVDNSNKIDVFSYGMMNLPRTPGFHECECNTWTPYGDMHMNNQTFFLGNQPKLQDINMTCESTQTRKFLTSFPNGKIIVRLEVLMKGVDDLQVIFEKQQEEDDDY